MKKNLLLTLSVSLLSMGSILHAQFNASGTDYSNALAAQEKWSEDMANEFVSMPNSFACIIANSGADANPNAKWTSLIDEAACGLAEPDPKGATVYSSSAMQSARASNSSAQEVTAWFNAQGGARYIADVTLRKGGDALPPFGQWYFSFYNAGLLNSGTWTSYTKDTSNEIGYVDIAPSGDDIQILVATEMLMEEDFGGTAGLVDVDTHAKVLFVGGSSDNTKFIGKSTDVYTRKSDGVSMNVVTGGNFPDKHSMIAGATNSTHYYRVNIDTSGNLDLASRACFDRTQKFETTHRSTLFNATTGEKVNLTGGFGFNTASGQRGYLGAWGVWIEGGDTNFTTNSRSLAITNEDSVSYNLKWAPGKLQQKTLSEDTLSNGDSFKMWYDEGGEEVTAVWNTAGNKFVLNSVSGSATSDVDLSSTNFERYLWSDVKRAEVIWTGGDKVKLQNRKDTTFSSTFADATSTKFYSKYTWNWHTKASSLPYSLSAFTSANDPFSLMYDNGTASGSKTYFLTGSAPGGGLEANTLYLDDGSGELSTDDKPIRFDFGINEQRNKSTNFGSSDAVKDYTHSDSKWPYGDISLVLASEADTAGDTCDKAGGDYSGCTNYTWQFGAFPWDQSVAAYDSTGAAVTLDDPIMIEYTYVATDDRNNGMSIDIRTQDEYNPLLGCAAISDGTSTNDSNGDPYGELCSSVTPSDYAGSKFLLEFDGTEVQGMPGMDVCSDDLCQGMKYWVRLLNLKDGTELTDTKGNKYVFLANGVSSTFQPAANITDCATEIRFSSLADLGMTASDLPGAINRSSTDYPLPSSAWTDAPTTSKCTVTMGDTSNCN